MPDKIRVFYWKDMSELLKKKHKPQAFTLRPREVLITQEDKGICKVMAEDPLLGQEMNDAVGDVMDKLLEEMIKKYKAADEKAADQFQKTGEMKDVRDAAGDFKKEYDDSVDKAEPKAKQAMEKVWKEYSKNDNALRNYRIKIGFKVGLCAVGVATSIGVAATAVAGNLPAIIAGTLGAARALSTGIQALKTSLKSASQLYDELLNDLQELVTKYNKTCEAGATAKEVGAKAIEAFTTYSKTSIRTCESKLDAWKTKHLSGLANQSHQVARGLDEVLEWADYWDEQIQATDIEATQKAHESRSQYFVKSATKSIEHIAKIRKQIKDGEGYAAAIDKVIDQLKERINKYVFTGAALFIDFAVVGLEIWGGAGAGDKESVSKFCEEAAAQAEKTAIAAKALAELSEDLMDSLKK